MLESRPALYSEYEGQDDLPLPPRWATSSYIHELDHETAHCELLAQEVDGYAPVQPLGRRGPYIFGPGNLWGDVAGQDLVPDRVVAVVAPKEDLNPDYQDRMDLSPHRLYWDEELCEFRQGFVIRAAQNNHRFGSHVSVDQDTESPPLPMRNSLPYGEDWREHPDLVAALAVLSRDMYTAIPRAVYNAWTWVLDLGAGKGPLAMHTLFDAIIDGLHEGRRPAFRLALAQLELIVDDTVVYMDENHLNRIQAKGTYKFLLHLVEFLHIYLSLVSVRLGYSFAIRFKGIESFLLQR